MPGFFNIPTRGLYKASVDEIIASVAAEPAPSKTDTDAENAAVALKMLAATNDPALFALKDRDGTPLLQTDLQRDAALKVKMIFNGLPDARTRRKVLHKVRQFMNAARAKNKIERAKTEEMLARLRTTEETMRELAAWGTNPNNRLEKPSGTKFHDFMAALREGAVVDVTQQEGLQSAKVRDEYLEMLDPISVFLVEHDWASAFRNAEDYAGGEIHLPDEACAFECRIGGHHVIALAVEVDGAILLQPATLCTTTGRWLMQGFARRAGGGAWVSDAAPEGDTSDLIMQMLGEQMVAVCVALEAEVATSPVVRADYRLNQARERRGKLPIYDYHVVSLARRSRAEALPSDRSVTPGAKRRLHFRRGHWRHYESHKTWIKWMLVGDPDLGFVDKHYKL